MNTEEILGLLDPEVEIKTLDVDLMAAEERVRLADEIGLPKQKREASQTVKTYQALKKGYCSVNIMRWWWEGHQRRIYPKKVRSDLILIGTDIENVQAEIPMSVLLRYKEAKLCFDSVEVWKWVQLMCPYLVGVLHGKEPKFFFIDSWGGDKEEDLT